jgi:hypothetical protein
MEIESTNPVSNSILPPQIPERVDASEEQVNGEATPPVEEGKGHYIDFFA